MWTIFVSEGDCIVMCQCLHDGTVLHILHAGCRWPQSPCGPCLCFTHTHTRTGLVLTGPCRGPGPANVMSQPLLSSLSHVIMAIICCSPDVRACPPLCHWSHSCTLLSRGHRCTDPHWPAVATAGVHCLMTRITLRSCGALVRNPLPSLYSGLCCTPVHSAVHLYSTPGAPGLRYHSQSPLVAISWTKSMPRSHLTGSQAAVAGVRRLHRVPVIMELRPCPGCLYLCRLGALSPQLGMNAEAGLGCAGVTGVSCEVSLLSQCHAVSRYENIWLLRYMLHMLQRINVSSNHLINIMYNLAEWIWWNKRQFSKWTLCKSFFWIQC